MKDFRDELYLLEGEVSQDGPCLEYVESPPINGVFGYNTVEDVYDHYTNWCDWYHKTTCHERPVS